MGRKAHFSAGYLNSSWEVAFFFFFSVETKDASYIACILCREQKPACSASCSKMTESDMDIYEHLMKTAASEKRITVKVWLCGYLAYRWVAGRVNCRLTVCHRKIYF